MSDTPRLTCLMFVWLMVTEVMVNFDGGGTAAVLERFSWGCRGAGDHYDPSYPCLNYHDQGILGSLPYFGLSFTAPIFGQLLQRHDEKWILVAGLFGNALATSLFAHFLNKHVLFVAKLLVGICHCGVVVYAPTWVTVFAPVNNRTIWLGLTQGSVALGVMFGYALTGYLVAADMHYQTAFKIQAYVLCGCVLILLFTPPEQICVSKKRKRRSPEPQGQELSDLNNGGLDILSGLADTQRPRVSGGFRPSLTDTYAASFLEGERPSTRQEIRSLVTNPVYSWTCLTLCALCFVVTGVQYWSSEYFKVTYQIPDAEVTSYFIAVAGTAPILGVILGGYLVDKWGGYQSLPGARRTASFCSALAVVSTASALAAALAHDFYTELVLIWVLLFTGGAVLSPATGLMLTSVPERYRTFANSLSALAQNLFGYALGAYLPGAIVEVLINHEVILASQATSATMKIVFGWAVFALVGMVRVYALLRTDLDWNGAATP
mmetsp:Transcript_48296/g.136481  ORF Transcript_48296/g.136481 Transcript_48296/m.136481 type:complete len:491 (+) Transcript_48296:106-1578(+)